MGVPDKAAASDSPPAATGEPASFADQVNQVVSQLTTNADGVHVFPEGLEVSDEVKFAATAEKRRRDAQSALGKTQQALKTAETEREALRERVVANAQVALTEEEQEELEELKFSDPDAWRVKMNGYEQRAATAASEELSSVSAYATQKGELARREAILADFVASNPGLKITDEVIQNDIPPRITRKLETNEVTFEEFLGEVKDFLTRGKAIKNEEVLGQPNLNNVGGSHTADPNAVQQDMTQSYANEIY